MTPTADELARFATAIEDALVKVARRAYGLFLVEVGRNERGR